MLLGLSKIIDCPGASVSFSTSVDLHDLQYGNCYPVSEPVMAEGTVRNTAGVLVMKGQISTEEKSRRLHALESICAENTKRILEREILESPEREVLFETFKDGYAYGHTDDFLEICVKSERDMRGEVAKVELISSDGKQIFGLLKK